MQRNLSSETDPATNIFIVGLMGAGKTSVGKILAKRLKKQFFDSDLEIERCTGVTISMIFEIEGEAGFRKRESSVLSDLAKLHGIVLATGGGVVLAAENRALLIENGFVIYLRATVNELWRRTQRDKLRPLLQTEDRLAKLKELFSERDPLYRQVADVVVDTSRQSPDVLAKRLEQILSKHLSNNTITPKPFS